MTEKRSGNASVNGRVDVKRSAGTMASLCFVWTGTDADAVEIVDYH